MWSSTGRTARALACGLATMVAVAAVSAIASAAPASTSRVTARAKSSKANRKGPTSIGAPNNGHLTGAARLRGSKTLRQREGMHSWGLPQLVHLLNHAATQVARKHHGAQMLVGDLSGRTGGHLDHHNSHQTGRDADVGFFVTNSKGKPMAVKRFIPFDDGGNARDVQGVHFDEARNWTMVEAMLKADKANVRYLFISSALRGKLLAYATKKHVNKELLDRAATVMMSPNDADLHDDHVHVRIACPESMHDVCIEEATAHVHEGPSAPAVKATDPDEKPDSAAPAAPIAPVAPAPPPQKAADSGAGDAR
jgi:penicillin-insensitive murein endopeptidase